MAFLKYLLNAISLITNEVNFVVKMYDESIKSKKKFLWKHPHLLEDVVRDEKLMSLLIQTIFRLPRKISVIAATAASFGRAKEIFWRRHAQPTLMDTNQLVLAHLLIKTKTNIIYLFVPHSNTTYFRWKVVIKWTGEGKTFLVTLTLVVWMFVYLKSQNIF